MDVWKGLRRKDFCTSRHHKMKKEWRIWLLQRLNKNSNIVIEQTKAGGCISYNGRGREGQWDSCDKTDVIAPFADFTSANKCIPIVIINRRKRHIGWFIPILVTLGTEIQTQRKSLKIEDKNMWEKKPFWPMKEMNKNVLSYLCRPSEISHWQKWWGTQIRKYWNGNIKLSRCQHKI